MTAKFEGGLLNRRGLKPGWGGFRLRVVVYFGNGATRTR